MNNPIQRLQHVCLLILLCMAAAATQAQTAMESFFRHPQIGTATLSPNGKYLAATTTLEGAQQLAIIELETNAAKNIVSYDKLDIHNIRWISETRLVYDVVPRGTDVSMDAVHGGLHAINRDGSKATALSQEVERSLLPNQNDGHAALKGMKLVAVAKDDPNSIIALGYANNGDVLPYRVDTLSERRKEIAFNVPGQPRDFVFDNNNVLRVVIATDAANKTASVWYRDQTEQAWKKLSEHPYRDPKFTPLAFDADNGTLFVSAPAEAGKVGIFKFDFASGKPGELVAADKSVDVQGGLVFSPDTHKLLGVSLATEPPRTLWLDKAYASTQAGIDKAFAGLVNVIFPSNPQAALLIHSYSSTHPGKLAVYYPDKKKLQNLFAARPGIDPKKMSEQRVYDYVARDGLPLMAYLTIPQGQESKGLPLVVLPHDGPAARDAWGFNSTVQFLTSLGYAVLQPQYRGSTGLGPELVRKGDRQWGLAMQDDLADGARSLVKQGVVDPARICIMGVRYGGYAALMGMVRDPDLYKCGISLIGVTNLGYLFTEGSWSKDQVAERQLKETLGDPSAMRDQFVATSPMKHADKIKAPVLLAYAEKDPRVPLVHGEDMRDALKQAGKLHEWLLLEKEDFGLSTEDGRLKAFGAVEAFLKKYCPAK